MNPGTHADHQQRAQAFRAQLLAGNWPEEEANWLGLDIVATCRTPGCPVEGIGFERRLLEQADGYYRSSCGRCSTNHTDLVATFSDGPVRLPVMPPPPPPPPGSEMPPTGDTLPASEAA